MKIKKVLLPLLIAPMLIGCKFDTKIISDKSVSIAGVSNLTATQIMFSCKKCEGEIIYRITVTEECALNLNFDVEIGNGSVTYTVLDNGGAELATQEVSKSMTFDVPLTEYAKYKIKINHSDFKGKYTIDWSKKN